MLSCSFCEYPFIFHCLHCSPSCFDPDSLLLAHLWLGLSWIDYISANKRFSSPKTSSRKPYTSSKQQERQKHSVETTINFSLSVNHIPPLPIPHGLEYPLGSRMHLHVVHPRLEARGQPFPRSPWARSRVNLRVLRSLTRGSQGQPSPQWTPHGRPGVQGIFPTSRGQDPHGWPMVQHSMVTGFQIPRGCCLALLVSSLTPCPIPLCLIPAPARSQRPMDSLPRRAVVRP